MKQIVVYYSNKGSNRYLAKKIAERLSCDIEEIRPGLNLFFLFLLNFNPGIKPLKSDLTKYDRIIMCGPVWMGRFIPPLRSFVRKYSDKINKLIFVSCCGSPFSKRDEKFGHGVVFKEVEKILGDKCIYCQAFPVGLVLPDGHKEDPDAFMNTHLSDDNFKGEIQELFDSFINKLRDI